eukprot:CAMPEP_0175046504 /NCGR_PEP_ID=MMETSP0052_2-20121109/5068_1 /TAXON_ID=51329 ORGANISM="Polytomella parva, Strain SAG 63-3" /NCGR_SAMPLE_ID=MMETSP0052_2 /ASSEMBLY_ACC=CAM_ASM_000194 /LENGTH=349 /DNA_ID=CAMNT_0016310259 /DNA_START=22 /DNA_END=1071 /DNA_ORIENTATION=+
MNRGRSRGNRSPERYYDSRSPSPARSRSPSRRYNNRYDQSGSTKRPLESNTTRNTTGYSSDDSRPFFDSDDERYYKNRRESNRPRDAKSSYGGSSSSTANAAATAVANARIAELEQQLALARNAHDADKTKLRAVSQKVFSIAARSRARGEQLVLLITATQRVETAKSELTAAEAALQQVLMSSAEMMNEDEQCYNVNNNNNNNNMTSNDVGNNDSHVATMNVVSSINGAGADEKSPQEIEVMEKNNGSSSNKDSNMEKMTEVNVSTNNDDDRSDESENRGWTTVELLGPSISPVTQPPPSSSNSSTLKGLGFALDSSSIMPHLLKQEGGLETKGKLVGFKLKVPNPMI